MVATSICSVTIVFWKETASPLWRAVERRWKRNVVSRVSSVIVVIRLPVSCVSSSIMSKRTTRTEYEGWRSGAVQNRGTETSS